VLPPNGRSGQFWADQLQRRSDPVFLIQAFDPETARKIVAQDRLNVERHGVGNAIAQAL